MNDPEGRIHILYSTGGARLYSYFNGSFAQGISDLIREIASSVGVTIVSDEERLATLLKSGVEVDDLLSVERIINFLRMTSETGKMHRINADSIAEKKIERFSEIIVSYYKHISEQNKSEIEDFIQFKNLFPLKYNLDSNYISHIPSELKPYNEIKRSEGEPEMAPASMVKIKFPDYWAECRWVVKDALMKDGTTCIIVPDDFALVNVFKEFELYGIAPTVISSVPALLMNDSPLSFIKSALNAVSDEFSFDSVISLLESPHSGINPQKLSAIKKKCSDKNLTKELNDWKVLFDELNIQSEILEDVEELAHKLNYGMGLEEISVISRKYLGDSSVHLNKILNLLREGGSRYNEDPDLIISGVESLKEIPRVNIFGNNQYFISKPLDAVGLRFDNIYITLQDVSSLNRAFSEDSRELLSRIGLSGHYERFVNGILKQLTGSGNNISVTCSMLDSEFSYTESTVFYDSIEVDEKYMPREDIFIPRIAANDWEIASEYSVKNKYFLDSDLISSRIKSPLSATFIENYLGCHFKAFINGLLRIDKIDPPGEFLDPKTTGSLTHKILQDYYSTDLSPVEFSRLSENFIRSEIRNERYLSRRVALEFYRDKFIKNGKLSKFFRLDVTHTLELGRKVLYKEFRFPTNREDKFYYDIDGSKISLLGYVDRIDEHDGDLCIIDYKSSLSHYPKNELCDANEGKVQLFLYKLAVESLLKKKVKAAAYVSFKDVDGGLNTAGFYREIENEAAQVSKCSDIVNKALREFLAGDFDPVVKNGGSLWKCEHQLYCPLLSVCRVQERRW